MACDWNFNWWLRINDGRGDVAWHNDRASFGDDLILNAAHFSIILRNKYKPQMWSISLNGIKVDRQSEWKKTHWYESLSQHKASSIWHWWFRNWMSPNVRRTTYTSEKFFNNLWLMLWDKSLDLNRHHSSHVCIESQYIF